MAGPPHIETEIEFLTTEAGGKTRPARSGFWPLFTYQGQNWISEHAYPDQEEVRPGDTAKAYIRFLSPHEHSGKVYVGMPFEVNEGVQTIGHGTVTKVFDQLEVDAAEFG